MEVSPGRIVCSSKPYKSHILSFFPGLCCFILHLKLCFCSFLYCIPLCSSAFFAAQLHFNCCIPLINLKILSNRKRFVPLFYRHAIYHCCIAPSFLLIQNLKIASFKPLNCHKTVRISTSIFPLWGFVIIASNRNSKFYNFILLS